MKKRLMLLFLVLCPLVSAFECLTYTDCSELSCTGASRICVEGTCTYSGCIATGAVIGTGWTDSFLVWAGRLMALLGIAAIVMLFLPSMNTSTKLKVLAAVIGIILFIVLIAYLGGGEKAIGKLLGKTDRWDSAAADKRVMRVANSARLDIKENLVTKGVKEYKLKSPTSESVAIAFMLEPGQSVQSLHLNIQDAQRQDLDGHSVTAAETPFHTIYIWQMDDLAFVLAGPKDEAKRLVKAFFDENLSVAPLEEKRPTTIDWPPAVTILLPAPLTRDAKTVFTLQDNDSDINFSSITVTGVEGFEPWDCVYVNGAYNCSFEGVMKQGENQLSVQAADEQGQVGSASIIFMYDNEAWQLIDIFPILGAATNIPSVRFSLIDNESGIDLGSVYFTGLNKSKDQCVAIAKGLTCSFDNLPLSEGQQSWTINATDGAGNMGSAAMSFFYDSTRPNISIFNTGFTISDNSDIRNDSLMVDRRRHDIGNCTLISGIYNCKYDKPYSTVSVMDIAGNIATVEKKLTR
jgi:hypothetical protein